VVLDGIIGHTIPLVFDFQHGFEGGERTHLVLVVLHHTTIVVGVRIIVGSSPGSRVLVLSIVHPQDAVCSGQHLGCFKSFSGFSLLGIFLGRLKENEVVGMGVKAEKWGTLEKEKDFAFLYI